MNRRFSLALTLAIAFLLVGAERAAAYDFKICSHACVAVYVHVHTVSAMCHDRAPVADGETALSLHTRVCVSGNTAPGCLIDEVLFKCDDGKVFTWSGIGVPGGTFTLQQTGFGGPWVCFRGWPGGRDDCFE